MTAVVGPSGSGKTTLLNLIAALDFPTEGSVRVDGVETSALLRGELQKYRNEKVGMIFQQFFLIDHMTAKENVKVPLIPRKYLSLEQKDELVSSALAKVGLGDKGGRLISELSGGELQRVAVARGLVGNSAILLADEPTGNLDLTTGLKIMELLAEESRDGGKTVIISTHDPRVLGLVSRTLYLQDGALLRDEEKHPSV
jgi:putative ABC transport system ATP-binding protein